MNEHQPKVIGEVLWELHGVVEEENAVRVRVHDTEKEGGGEERSHACHEKPHT